jgi:TRAP transporter TAXI family solute receptor
MLLFSFLTLGLLSCSGSQSRTTEFPLRFLSVGTAPPGGAFFVVGSAIADIIQAGNSEKGWQVNAEATKGTQENIRRLNRGEIDLALANAAITYFAVRGESGWEKTYDMRAVMTLAPNVAMFVTLADSGIKNIVGLKGQRVVIGPSGAGFEMFVEPILEAHGLRYDDLTVLHAGQSAAVDMLFDGAARAAFLGGAIPTASITQAAATHEITLLPLAEGKQEELTRSFPFFHAAVIPSETYRNVNREYRGLNVGSMHLITAAAADEEMIYAATRALYENREEFSRKHPVGRTVNPVNAVRKTGVQFHPGAIRYYREIGIWND